MIIHLLSFSCQWPTVEPRWVILQTWMRHFQLQGFQHVSATFQQRVNKYKSISWEHICGPRASASFTWIPCSYVSVGNDLCVWSVRPILHTHTQWSTQTCWAITLPAPLQVGRAAAQIFFMYLWVWFGPKQPKGYSSRGISIFSGHPARFQITLV